jgi:hypothetical protein
VPLPPAAGARRTAFSSPEQAAQFQRILAWSGRSEFGDIAELDGLADDSPLLPMVTSTVDNCLGTDCPFWDDCFVVRARQRAQAADVVVVNHHLLLADLALKQDGFGELLPGAQAFVIDEAHQLPELAAQFFGEGFGMRPWQELGRDCLAEARGVAARSRRCRNRSTSCSRRCWRCARRWRAAAARHAVARAGDATGARWIRYGDGRPGDAGAGTAAAARGGGGPGCLPCAGARGGLAAQPLAGR